MKIFYNTNIPKKYKKAAIAIGNFDGVHRGHQKVFKYAKILAQKKKTKFGVLTFTPLPVMFFNKKIKNHRLVNEKEKFELLKKCGVNFIINIRFNKNFSQIEAEKFIKNIIYKKINPCLLSVSNNFRFGYKRRGDISLLKKFSKKYNYEIVNTLAFKHNKKIVSSTRIRECLKNGKINLANQLLSRNWFIDGLVERGEQLGRKLGYRTCNIHIKNYILPKFGVYAVKVMIGNNNRIHEGAAYLGSRPTFQGKKVFLEINIFRINKNLYKKRLRVYFVKFIRKDKKFNNSLELIKQIDKDVYFIKKGIKAKLAL